MSVILLDGLCLEKRVAESPSGFGCAYKIADTLIEQFLINKVRGHGAVFHPFDHCGERLPCKPLHQIRTTIVGVNQPGGHKGFPEAGPDHERVQLPADISVSPGIGLNPDLTLDRLPGGVAVRIETGGPMVPFDGGQGSTILENPSQFHQGPQGIGHMFQNEADKDMVERTAPEGERIDVLNLEPDIFQIKGASELPCFPGGGSGNIHGHEPCVGVAPGKDPGLGADPAPCLENEVAGGIQGIKVQQVGQDRSLVMKSVGFLT